MPKIKFSLEIGFLLRGEVRSALKKLKSDIVYRNPKSKVSITENKGWFESEFCFVATGVDDIVAMATKKSIEKWISKMEE